MEFFSKFMIRSLMNRQLNAYKLKALLGNLYYAWRRIPNVTYGPSALWVEPVNYCNLCCDGCWVPAKQKYTENKAMDIEVFKRNVKSVRDTLILLILQMSGEPFLHKSIFEMIRYATDNNIAVWTSSNCSFQTDKEWAKRIVDSRLHTLNISVSGITQETYKRYHKGGNIDRVQDNIKKIQKAKKSEKSKTPYLYFRVLLTDENRRELPDIRKLGKRLGVEVITREIYRTFEYKGTPRKTIDPSSIKITAKDEPQCLKNHCYGLWIAPALKSDNEVLPCCYDWIYPPVMGKTGISGPTVKEIWHSQKFNQFRAAILKDRRRFASCRYCDNTIGFKDSLSDTHVTVEFK